MFISSANRCLRSLVVVAGLGNKVIDLMRVARVQRVSSALYAMHVRLESYDRHSTAVGAT